MLEAARALGDRYAEATSLANLAHHRDPGGDPDEAPRLFVEAEEAARNIGSDRLAGLAEQRAFFEFNQGRLAEAEQHWSEAVRVGRRDR